MPLLAALLVFAATPEPATKVQDAYPVISPDGGTLLFQSTRSGRWALWKANADGSKPHIFLDPGDDPVTPSWSPDGALIAYAATVDGQSQLFVVNADGSDRRQLTATPGDNSHPHFAMTGRLFFNSARATPDPAADWSDQHHDVYSVKADGSDLKRHPDCKTVCTFASLSPDGQYLAFRKVLKSQGRDWAQQDIAVNSEIFVKRLRTGKERNLSSDPAFDGWPVWTPDSKWIVFASARGGRPFTGEIYAVRPEGGEPVKLTEDAWSNAQPSVSPDGKTLLTYRTIETDTVEFGHIGRMTLSLP